jgi:hypothetical protein
MVFSLRKNMGRTVPPFHVHVEKNMATDVTDHRGCDQIQRGIPTWRRLQGLAANKADVAPDDRLAAYNYSQSL